MTDIQPVYHFTELLVKEGGYNLRSDLQHVYPHRNNNEVYDKVFDKKANKISIEKLGVNETLKFWKWTNHNFLHSERKKRTLPLSIHLRLIILRVFATELVETIKYP
mgnify:CR=1 FL=1